jgi:hypothetical protein
VIVIVVTTGLSSLLGITGAEAAMFGDEEPDESEPVTIAFVSLPSGSIGPMFFFGFNHPNHKFASNEQTVKKLGSQNWLDKQVRGGGMYQQSRYLFVK